MISAPVCGYPRRQSSIACSSCNSGLWGPQWRWRRGLTWAMAERAGTLSPLWERRREKASRHGNRWGSQTGFLSVSVHLTYPLKCSWANLKSWWPSSMLSSPYWWTMATVLLSRWEAAFFQSPTQASRDEVRRPKDFNNLNNSAHNEVVKMVTVTKVFYFFVHFKPRRM